MITPSAFDASLAIAGEKQLRVNLPCCLPLLLVLKPSADMSSFPKRLFITALTMPP